MTKIQVRRGTTAEWASAQSAAGATPILAAGEIGFITSGDDAGKFKVGNGSSLWGSLSAFVPGAAFNTSNNLTLGTNITATTGSSPWNGSAAITIDLPSSLTGVNASTATALATGRTINGASFNGSTNVILGGAVYGTTATAGSTFKNIYVTQSAPSAPANGDVWISW